MTLNEMMKLEGNVLDTCCTGKAFAGLVRHAREGVCKPDDNALFVHTGGAGDCLRRIGKRNNELGMDEK